MLRFPTESAAEVVIAAGGGARGILGVVDGMARKGMEGNGREWKGMEGSAEIESRKGLPRQIGGKPLVPTMRHSGAIQGEAFAR